MSFYAALGGGRFRATAHTSGPWDRVAQHAGPPAALLARELERTAPRDGMLLARVTLEILGPIPVAELEVETSVLRPGRSVELLGAELRAGGRPVVRASAWRVRAAQGEPTPAAQALPPPRPDAGAPLPAAWEHFGYGHAVEWRFARGEWERPGPAAVWTRLKVPVVEGEAPSPLQRVMAVADSASGVSNERDWTSWLFINPELTVHALRPAQGEWICLDAATAITPHGPAVARSTLWDAKGPVAYGAQSLLVAARS